MYVFHSVQYIVILWGALEYIIIHTHSLACGFVKKKKKIHVLTNPLTAESVASFLKRTPSLDKTKVGSYLGGNKDVTFFFLYIFCFVFFFPFDSLALLFLSFSCSFVFILVFTFYLGGKTSRYGDKYPQAELKNEEKWASFGGGTGWGELWKTRVLQIVNIAQRQSKTVSDFMKKIF